MLEIHLSYAAPKVAVFLITKHKLHVHLFVILEGWKWSLSGEHRINRRGPTQSMMRKVKTIIIHTSVVLAGPPERPCKSIRA